MCAKLPRQFTTGRQSQSGISPSHFPPPSQTIQG